MTGRNRSGNGRNITYRTEVGSHFGHTDTNVNQIMPATTGLMDSVCFGI